MCQSGDGTQIAASARVGEGVIIQPGCLIGTLGSGEPVDIGSSSLVRSHTIIYGGSTIGSGFSCGHGVLIREGTKIGADCSVGSHSVLEHTVLMEDNVRLHSNCFVPEHSVLKAGSWLGPGVIVTNARYPNRMDTKHNLEGVLIEEGAIVGAGAILLPGIVVGVGALVGAGAVVVRDVPAGARIVGNPGRELGA